MKNPLTNFSLVGIAIGVMGFLYQPAQKVVLTVIILLCFGVLFNYVRERRSVREISVVGGFMLPILISAFFFKFAADLAFSAIVIFFVSLLVLSVTRVVSEKQKHLAARITWFGAFALALALNYRPLFELTQRHTDTTHPTVVTNSLR